MANTPKKVKDPTEVALSAIEEALNINDAGASNDSGNSSRTEAASPLFCPRVAIIHNGVENFEDS